MATTAPSAGTRRVLRIVSKCSTEEEFLSVFGRFCDEKSLFVVTATPRAVGSSSRFSITLADGKPMLIGTGEVIESYPTATSPYGRPGMRLEFTELDDDSKGLVVRLAAAGRATAAAATPKANAPGGSALKKTIMFGVPGGGKPLAPRTPGPVAGRPGGKPPMPTPPPLPATPPATPPAMPPAMPTPGRIPTPPPMVASPPAQTIDDPATVPSLPSPPAPERPMAPVLRMQDHRPAAAAASVPEPIGDDLEAPTAVAAPPGAASSPRPGTEDEQRAPGSDYILPANPLGEVTDASLEAFVECTLYEETGSFQTDELERPDETPLPPPTPWARADATPPPGPLDAMGTGERGFAPPQIQAEALAQAPDWGAAAYAPGEVLQATELVKRPRRIGWPVIVGIAVATAAAALVVGYLVWGRGGSSDDGGSTTGSGVSAGGGDQGATAAGGATSGDDKGASASGDKGADTGDKGADTGDKGADTGDKGADTGDKGADTSDKGADTGGGTTAEVPPVGADDCAVTVTTEPAGAHVLADGKVLGDAPVTIALPCGTEKLFIHHPRYSDVSRTLKLRPGQTTEIKVDLVRPIYKLTVTSSPAGATVEIDGRTVGTTPVTTQLHGFEQMTLKVSKAGYETTRKRIYLSERSSAKRISLKKIPTPKPSRPTRPSKPPTR